MAHKTNHYKCDLRELRFLLFEQFGLDDLLGKGPFSEWSKDDIEMVLSGVYEWVCEVIGPLNAIGDEVGCTLKDGVVTTPPGFKEAWKSLYEAGWRGLGVSEEWGGQGGPFALAIAAGEMMSGANTAFNMYPGLSHGVAEVIQEFGTDEQKKTYLQKLNSGAYGGTMCLTESQAGSDVGAASTRAIALGDGKYKIEGTKIFISGGDHDLADNIMHLVLARTPDAPVGTKGLSLFVVPRDRIDGSGSNHVVCASLEHKMGINGSSTAVLNFGEGGDCIGELVGTEECRGMRQMFKMMNGARILVGVQGLAVAGSAYLNAVTYARERKQGPSYKQFKDASAPKVPIIEHPNVRRMLLDMKARTEGIRALIFKLAIHLDRARMADSDEDRDYHMGQVDLLVPLVKAYSSDQGFNITATAIQVYGGAGYTRDFPVEQYCRDAKIFSIYEGTNHIQALDLVGRKLGLKGGATFQAFLKDVGTFAAKHKGHPVFGDAVAKLEAASGALGRTAMQFLAWFQGGKFELVPLSANRFLEMMSATAVSWLLLEGAVIAEAKAADLAEDHPEARFYSGKRHAAIYFANLELPRVVTGADTIAVGDRSAMEIASESFSPE